MPTIGTFTRTGEFQFQGEINTLLLKVRATIRGNHAKAADNHPDFLIYSGRTQIGAAWHKANGDGEVYLSVSLDDPSFPSAINANLVQAKPGDGQDAGQPLWSLVWSRPARAH